MDNKKRILFFINGPVPTKEEQSLAFELEKENPRVLVCFRNIEQITPNDKCEKCIGVAGEIPKQYVENGYKVFNPYNVALDILNQNFQKPPEKSIEENKSENSDEMDLEELDGIPSLSPPPPEGKKSKQNKKS